MEKKFIFILMAVLCLHPAFPAAAALLLGILLSLTLGNPYPQFTRQTTPRLLQISVVGLGAGMNLATIGQVGLEGVGYTAVGIALTFFLGLFIGKLFKVDLSTSLLVTAGTAICGGSAIAAVASTIRAKSDEISMALVTVFLLNASALFFFPLMGHFFGLTQRQFGLLSALAIHDTSSVVGAALQYGTEAVEVATTVKLARALWIIPVTLGVGWFWNRGSREKKGENVRPTPKRPWFILGFLLAAALVTWVPALKSTGASVSFLAKRTLVLTLFLIGAGISRDTFRNIGFKPLLQGMLLWLFVTSATLSSLYLNWIS